MRCYCIPIDIPADIVVVAVDKYFVASYIYFIALDMETTVAARLVDKHHIVAMATSIE